MPAKGIDTLTIMLIKSTTFISVNIHITRILEHEKEKEMPFAVTDIKAYDVDDRMDLTVNDTIS